MLNNSLWKPCQFNCSKEEKYSLKRHINNKINNTNGIYFSIFLNSQCSLKNVGDNLNIFFLPFTNEKCGVFSILGRPIYYLIQFLKDVKKISLFCNSNCQNCTFYEENIKLNYCYKMDQISFFFQNNNTPLCFIENKEKVIENNTYWIIYNGTNQCNLQFNDLQLINIGIPNQGCIPLNINNSIFYNNIYYNLSNQHYNIDLFCNESICNSCLLKYSSLLPNKCINNSFSKSFQFLLYSNIPFCHYENYSNDKMHIVWIIIIISILIFIIIIFKTGHNIIWNKETMIKIFNINLKILKNLFLFSKKIYRKIFNKLLLTQKIINIIITSFGFPSKKNIIWSEIILLLFLLLGSIAYNVVWWKNNPFSLFKSNTFSEIGISNGSINIEKEEIFFENWSLSGKIQSIVMTIFIYLFFISRFFFIKPKSLISWQLGRLITFLIFILANYFLFLTPPFLKKFSNMIFIMDTNNKNFITKNTQLISEFNKLINFSFSGIIFSYLSNIYLFLLHGLPIGIYLGSLCFIISKINQKLNREILTLILIINCVLILIYPATSALSGKIILCKKSI